MSAIPLYLGALGAWLLSSPCVPTQAPGSAARPSPARPACPARQGALAAPGAPVPGVRFVENRGQWPDQVRFLERCGPARVWCLADGFVLDLVREHGARRERLVVSQRLRGAGGAGPRGQDPVPGLEHWFRGPRRGLACRSYATLLARDLGPGISLRLRAPEHAGSALEYDLLLAPGADLGRIVFDCEGVEHLALVDGGRALRLVTRHGAIEQRIPRTWEEGLEGRRELTARFVLRGPKSFGFVVPGRDPTWALTIDPGLEYGSFWGGGGVDEIRGMTRDPKGRLLLVGSTSSSDFPQSTGSYSEALKYAMQKPRDGFVTCLEPDAKDPDAWAIAWSTFLGGNDIVELEAVATDAGQRVCVAGHAFATDYPTTSGAAQAARHGTSLYQPYQSDLVLTVLAKDGASLAYSSYLGGPGFELAAGLGFDDKGMATVVGEGGAGFPTTSGVVQGTAPSTSGVHAIAARFDTGKGTVAWATYVGGTAWGRARAVALRGDGSCWIAGETRSTDFPTTPAALKPKPLHTSGDDGLEGFVLRLSPLGDKLEASTYVGGSDEDSVACLLAEPGGDLLVGGWTRSKDLVVPKRALQPGYRGDGSPPVAQRGDGFVLRLDAALGQQLAGTYYGGTGEDEVTALALGAFGDVWLGGQTGSADLTGHRGLAGGTYVGCGYASWRGDAYVARLSPDLVDLFTMSYHGGSDVEELRGLVYEAARGTVLLAGTTRSGDLPVTEDALMKGTGSYYGGFLARRSLGLDSLTVRGTATPCDGAMGFEPIGPVIEKDADFALRARGLPRTAPGLLVIGVKVFPQEIALGAPLGGTMLVDPDPSLILPLMSDGEGRCRIPLPLTELTRAQLVYLWMQSFWFVDARNPCKGAGLLRNSVALGMDVLGA